MAEKRKKSKYQLKLRARTALANKVGGAFHSPTKDKDGKDRRRLPFAMPVLLQMKRDKDAGLLEEIEEVEEVTEPTPIEEVVDEPIED